MMDATSFVAFVAKMVEVEITSAISIESHGDESKR